SFPTRRSSDLDIERHYLKMLTQARREVIIANAFFFPGYRFLHALRKAARRGVRIKLIDRKSTRLNSSHPQQSGGGG
ncbi:phospholipase D-like domain-containing protein, partial [Escherichia coli]